MALSISKDFLEEIGRVSILQSHIEGGLAIVVGNLAGVETAVGDVLAKPLSFRNLSEIASSLLDLRADQLELKCTPLFIVRENAKERIEVLEAIAAQRARCARKDHRPRIGQSDHFAEDQRKESAHRRARASVSLESEPHCQMATWT
jgi:hypothetical protein